MRFDRKSGYDSSSASPRTGDVATPGKRTLTEVLGPAPMQRARAEAGAASDGTGVHAAAAYGTSGAAAPLPHLDLIQRSFGRHDVSRVRAHVGGSAAEGAAAMGAEAFATGDRVAFASAPDLHTAAHEAAHVVQQRAGVHLKGGVGETGDRYEQHADAVAERVVRGESAVALLDEYAPSSGGPAVQRRVTTAVAEHNLLTNDEDGAANLEGLKQAARRTFLTLSQPARLTVLNASEYHHGMTPMALLEGSVAQVKALTALLRSLSPDLEYDGAAGTFAHPQGHAEITRFDGIVGWAVTTMAKIGGGEANAAITAVFGNANAGTVRARFAHVGAQLGTLAQSGKIYGDRTGAREAMDAGALTSFGRYIQMNRSFLRGTDDGSADGITLMHEALHYFYAEITDDGGYADQVEAFKTRPAAVKLNNAPHYEEVIRRYTNKGPVGGDFVPEDHHDAPERTPLQRAIGAAAGVLQTAWERALNIHGFLIACHDHPEVGTRRAQIYYSSLLQLTMHRRAPRVDNLSPLLVNDIDLVGVESATRMLTTMKKLLRPELLAVEERSDNVHVMRNLLIQKVAHAAGPLTGATERDVQVVTALDACPRDVSTVDLDPVGY